MPQLYMEYPLVTKWDAHPSIGWSWFLLHSYFRIFKHVQTCSGFKTLQDTQFRFWQTEKKSSLSTVVSESLTHSKKDFDVASLVRLLQRMVQKKMWLSTILNPLKQLHSTAKEIGIIHHWDYSWPLAMGISWDLSKNWDVIIDPIGSLVVWSMKMGILISWA